MNGGYKFRSEEAFYIRCRNCGTLALSTKDVLRLFRFTCRCCRRHRYERVTPVLLDNEHLIDMCREADKTVYGSDE